MSATTGVPQIDLVRALRLLLKVHGDRPWSADDLATAAEVLRGASFGAREGAQR